MKFLKVAIGINLIVGMLCLFFGIFHYSSKKTEDKFIADVTISIGVLGLLAFYGCYVVYLNRKEDVEDLESFKRKYKINSD